VQLKTLLKKTELRVILNLIVLSLSKTASLYTGGNHEQLSNISDICKQLLINESVELFQKVLFQNSMMNQMINQKKMSNKQNTVTHHGKLG